jgi:hypothetical protein
MSILEREGILLKLKINSDLRNPYQLLESDSGYIFTTDRGLTYYIYFLDYSSTFLDYPRIVCPVYTFNIDLIEGDHTTSPEDPRIGDTIAAVFAHFFKGLDNVAIYVCDSIDDRQQGRKRKFDLWFYMYNSGDWIKEDGEQLLDGVRIFTSMIISKQNFQLNELILAFKELHEREDIN